MPLNTEKFKYVGLKNTEMLPDATGIYGFKKGKDFLPCKLKEGVGLYQNPLFTIIFFRFKITQIKT